MKRAPLLSLALAPLLLSRPAYAQMMEVGQLSVYGGSSLPQGEFGATDAEEEGSGYAEFGFSVMGEYTYPVGPPGLGWASSISLMANESSTEILGNEEDDSELEELGGEVSRSAGYWFNVPIMTGAKYQTEVSPTLDLHGQGQVGLNVNRGPKRELTISLEDIPNIPPELEGGTLEQTYDGTATSFGFALGAGATFNDQINLSVRYLNFGEPELGGEVEASEGLEDLSDALNVPFPTGDLEYNQPLSMIQIVVGYNF